MTRDRDTQPHIVLLTCHDIGRSLGCYGATTVQTPNLDALAASGIRMARAFSTSPSCSPSRAAIATGRYPHSNGVMGLAHPPYGWELKQDERHVASVLRAAGYETHLFGFQHVTPHVDRLGFEHLHGFDQLVGCHERALGMRVAQRIETFLSAEVRGRTLARPLYLEVNLEEPHRPYDQDGTVPDETLGVHIPGYLPHDDASREEMAALQGAIRKADQAIGVILCSLEAVGIAEDTLLIFSADHGIAMPRAKCTLYDPGIATSLLLRWPAGGLSGGRVVQEMISNIDILPTLLEAARVPVLEQVQGQSFYPLLRGESYIPRTAVYAEKTYHSYYDPMRAIRTERFKYIRHFEVTSFGVEVPADVQLGPIFRANVELYHGFEHPPAELYDLDADPLEQHNLADDPRLTEVERWLDTQLASWMMDTDDPLLYGPIPSPTSDLSGWVQQTLNTKTDGARIAPPGN